MTDKLTQIEKRYLEVEESLSDADVVSDMERYKALMKEYKELTPITEAFRAYKKCCADLEEAELLLKEEDPELKELAAEQAEEARASKEKLTEELKLLGFDEVVFSEFRFPETDKIVYRQDKQEALKTALDTLLNTCGTSTFTLSFTVSSPDFALPEGRCRMYLINIPARDVEITASQATISEKEIRMVFIADSNDTRYDTYSVLRTIDLLDSE